MNEKKCFYNQTNKHEIIKFNLAIKVLKRLIFLLSIFKCAILYPYLKFKIFSS